MNYNQARAYKDAISNYEQYLSIERPKPEKLADINAHMGYAKWLMGKKEEGIKMIRDAIKILENPSQEFVHEGKNVAIIWKTGVKLYLVRVLDNKDEAKQLAQEVIEEAKTKDSVGKVNGSPVTFVPEVPPLVA